MKKLGIAIWLATSVVFALQAAAADKNQNQGNNPTSDFYGRCVKATIKDVFKNHMHFTDIKVVMAPAEGGANIEFIFPEEDGLTQKPVVFDDATLKYLHSLKPGDMCHIIYNIQNGNMHVCQHIETYTPVPGEEEPNVYIFTQKGDPLKGMPTFAATKMKKTYKFALPPAKALGKPAPDPKMVAALSKFKANDLVEVEMEKGAIKTLKLWEPPKMADLNAISPKPNDKGFITIEVVDALETKTLVVPKNKMGLLGKLRPLLRENAKSKSVLYQAVPDEKDPSVVWLKDIKPTPEGYVAPEVASGKTTADSSGGTAGEGVFLSTGKTKVFRSGETVDFVEIQTNPDPQHVMTEKYMVSSKDAAALMPKASALKKDTPVTFKFSESLDGKWMSDIAVKEAKPPATKPAEDPKKADKTAQ